MGRRIEGGQACQSEIDAQDTTIRNSCGQNRESVAIGGRERNGIRKGQLGAHAESQTMGRMMGRL